MTSVAASPNAYALALQHALAAVPGLTHRTASELGAQIPYLRAAPARVGTLDLLVRRPARFVREILAEAEVDVSDGLLGDNWLERATLRAILEGRHVDAQLNVMSARMVRVLADSPEHQALAGDQLYLDLDIAVANLPTGSRIAIGDTAVIEVTSKPHQGCAKFRARFGEDALAFVNSEVGRELRLRGFNARVVVGGTVRPGDPVRKLSR